MRNSLEILKDIDTIFVDQKLIVERQKLEIEIMASSTGSELCLRAGCKLLALQKQNIQIDKVAGKLIKEFIAYCNANGLYPKIVK